MKRLLCVIGISAVVLMQTVAAAAAPSPSPGLDGILLAPPTTDFVEADKTTPGLFEGPFDAAGYAAITSSTDVAGAKSTLGADGFLGGFGRTWFSKKTNHIYVEAVMAFNGGKGAKAWLSQSERADKAEATYQHPITITGIDSYYGARLADTVQKIYADAYVFVKGNDTYLISTVSSGKDDLATTAATQAKLQFDSAPPYTVPPGQWPESTATNGAATAAKVVGGVVSAIVILVLIAGAFLVMRSRRRPMLQAAAVLGAPAAPAVPLPVVQMSDDRRSWWDGTNWRDAEHDIPPAAQRSDDGKFWWDGQTWRAVPGSPAG